MVLLHGKFIFGHTRTIFCCSVVGSERAFSNSAHSFKHVALLKGILYVNNIKYCICCRDIDFSKRGTAPLKGELDIRKCTLHSFSKGMVQFFKEDFICCLDIAPAKTHS